MEREAMDSQISIAIVVAGGWLIVTLIAGLRAPAQLPRSMMVLATAFMLPGAAFAGSPATLHGFVQSGDSASAQPLTGVKVTLYEASTASPRALDSAKSDSAGRFTLTAPADEAEGVFYVSAAVDKRVEFVAVVGQTLPESVTINELTTVAAGYSMAQFYQEGEISGDPFSLQLAAGMNDNIVDPATGASSPVLLASPNADETISLRSTRALANLLAACVESKRISASFLALTKPQRGKPPRSTAQALANLARAPEQAVSEIFQLTRRAAKYEPALLQQPDAWTVAVKVNDSGSDIREELFGGPANLAFDAKGFAWLTNNVKQGDSVSSKVAIVLQPNGKPANGANGTPLSLSGTAVSSARGSESQSTRAGMSGSATLAGAGENISQSLASMAACRSSRRPAQPSPPITATWMRSTVRRGWHLTTAISGSRASARTASSFTSGGIPTTR